MFNAQAIVRRSINNASNQFDRLAHVGNNLSNFNTSGYKCVRFEQILKESGYVEGAIRTDVKQGSLRITDNPYDIAIEGQGYIPVTSPDGQIQYTRDGAFKRGADGYLCTVDDWVVGDGIKFPANCYKFQVRENGDVISYSEAGGEGKKIGTIPIVTFDAPEELKQGVNNKMEATEESGQPKLVLDHDRIRQGYSENSNTNIYAEINDMLRLNASMIASMRLLKVADDMYNKGINIRE